jgi:hypothetical protein
VMRDVSVMCTYINSMWVLNKLYSQLLLIF